MFPLLAAALAVAPLDQIVAKVDPSVVLVQVGTRTSVSTTRHASVRVDIATGSGVLLHAAGFVATAGHVVEDAEVIEAHFVDGSKTACEVVTLSRSEDLALLKCEKVPANATVATLADSDAVKVGQPVFSIGAPLGLEHTLTTGVVSALRSTPVPGLHPRRLLQTDAALNKGNSGGPLFNAAGEVVGIASFIASVSGGSMGLNFAVPSNVVRQRLFERPLPYVGLSLRVVTRELAELMNWPIDGGLLVERVRAESPAAKAGLKGGSVEVTVADTELWLGGDLIVAVNGLSPAEGDGDTVATALRALKPGEVIRYEVLRGGRRTTVEVPIPDMPALPKLGSKGKSAAR